MCPLRKAALHTHMLVHLDESQIFLSDQLPCRDHSKLTYFSRDHSTQSTPCAPPRDEFLGKIQPQGKEGVEGLSLSPYALKM